MRVLPAHNRESLDEAQRVLRQGGIVAHPTETCYGFACDLTNLDAVKKLFALKRRPADQPVSALFSSVEETKKYVEWNKQAEELARKYLPGPLTFVLPLKARKSAKYHLSINGTDLQETVGVRVSSHPVAQRLAELCNIPLSTTSANLHGGAEPYSVAEILAQFASVGAQHAAPREPDLILDGGTLPQVPPSTVVIVKKGKVEVVRDGGIKIESLHECCTTRSVPCCDKS